MTALLTAVMIVGIAILAMAAKSMRSRRQNDWRVARGQGLTATA